MPLHLHAAGHFHPENEITNQILEELDIGTTESWILDRVGIRARRTVLPLDYIRSTKNQDPREAIGAAIYDNTELARRAAELAMQRSGITSDQIGLVIGGGSAPDLVTPATGCAIAEALGIECTAFDVISACTTILAQIRMLSCMAAEALPDFILLVVPEAGTKIVDYTDRASAVLWGDGAVAMILSPRVAGRGTIGNALLASSPKGAGQVRVPRQGFFSQNGRAVQTFAIRKTAEVLRSLAAVDSGGWRGQHFIGHQANALMLEAVCRECGIGPALHHSNVEWFGNTASAGAVSVLSMRWEEWKPGDEVAIVGVGAGLTWGGCLVRFGRAS